MQHVHFLWRCVSARAVAVAVGILLATTAALAQASAGRLVGTVRDQAGSVVGGATITVKDGQTGRERTVTSSAEGTFLVPELDFGTYTVSVKATGFKSFSATDVKIDAGLEYALNVELQAGGAEEVVEVSAGAVIVNTTNGVLGTTVEKRQVLELPLNGRNPLALISLQAGANPLTASINGQRSSSTNYTRDGLNVQDNFIRTGGFVSDRPNVDDTAEITIVTGNSGAELGNGSSQVQVATPRGGTEYHGAGFIYNRNSEFAANTFFNNANGLSRPFLNRNQFGGNFSGPIPGLKKKVFFFFAYEGFRLRQTQSQTRTILLPDARQGNFTYIDNAGVRRTTNVLQLARLTGIDPLIQRRILANVPTAGNRTDVGDQLNTQGLTFLQGNNQDREALTWRFDYDISDKQSITTTYSYRREFLQRADIDGGGFQNTPFAFQDANTPFLATAWRYTITPRLSNELRGGFQFSDPAFGRRNEPTDFLLAIPLISSPEDNFRPQGRDTEYYNIQDNATYTREQHSFRFGGQIQFWRAKPYNFAGANLTTYGVGTNVNTPQFTTGQFAGGISPTQLGTANALLALLGGFVSNASQTFNATDRNSGFVRGAGQVRRLNYEDYSLYVSDQWRVTPQLTLNLALRYDLVGALREGSGLALEPVLLSGRSARESVLDPNGTFNFVGTSAGGTKFFNTDKNNFAPIVSVAYAPKFGNKFLNAILPGEGKSAIRGGFRISYVNDEYIRSADNALLNNAGLNQGVSLVNQNARFDSLPVVPVPTFSVPRTFTQNNALAGRQGAAFAIDPGLQVQKVYEYNFGIQREIGFDTAIEIRYVGGYSDQMVRSIDFNQVDIRSNGFIDDFNRARRNLIANGDPTRGEALTVFPLLANGGSLNSAANRNFLINGTPADMAVNYYILNQTGGVRFLANPNIFVANVLTNGGRYRYNSLQTEIRRRFSDGLTFQGNYTFQKILTDVPSDGQTRVDPFLDNLQPGLEYSRADYDRTHTFNFNALYELPFGKGKKFLNRGGWLDRLVGGWQVSSIIQISSGAPLTLFDTRGTLNRAGRSGRQTPTSNLTKDQIKDLAGVRRTPQGIFFFDPSIRNATTGRGAEGFGTTPFAGQVFFNNAPGRTGNVERAFLNGPVYYNWDASIVKNIRIKDNLRVQLRAEAFNLTNSVRFGSPNTDINSVNFGRITGAFAPRIVQFVGRVEF